MDNDFFEPSGGGDPTYQHIIWFLGHPSVWLTLLLWVLILIAVVKITKRLRRANKNLWVILFLATVGAAILCYAWLSINAFHSYTEGNGHILQGLRYAKYIVILLSTLSGVWIITDWLKARR